MLKQRKKSRREVIATAALAFCIACVMTLVNAAVIWLGMNLALAPWTETRIGYWAAVGMAILVIELRDLLAPRKVD
jgi:hypothetical protein